MSGQIGLIQGRLSPRPKNTLQAFPWKTWQDEFHLAKKLGFAGLEWIYEAEKAEQNPIWTDAGIELILNHIHETGVQVLSVCADYFMMHRLAGGSEADRRKAVEILQRLIVQSKRVGARRILLPLLESSALSSDALKDQAEKSITTCLSTAESQGITLGLEMDVGGREYAQFINRFSHPLVQAYYDTGNSTAKGFDIENDVCWVKECLCAIHIKDRKLGGESQPLGSGDANFHGFFSTIADFKGDFVLQSYFQDDPVREAYDNLEFVRRHIQPEAKEAH